jgi:hypothetical protein
VVRPPYQAVIRLFANAERYWPQIDGEAIRSGAGNYLELSPDRFCNAVQSWIMERVKDPEAFVRELERPLGGSARTPSQAEMNDEGAGFMAFASMMGVKPPTVLPTEEQAAV